MYTFHKTIYKSEKSALYLGSVLPHSTPLQSVHRLLYNGYGWCPVTLGVVLVHNG